MLKFGSGKQIKKDGPEESLLGLSSKLQAENLRVLAGDVEDSIAEASSAIAGRIDEANLQRAHKAVLLANEAMEELKLQGRQSARLDQAACEMLSKAYGRQLEELTEKLKSAELVLQSGQGGKEGAENRMKAAAERLQRVRQVQADSEASVQRSLGIVEGAQQLGAETAVAMKTQTEQMKNIYADVTQMEGDLNKAKKILTSMARRAVTDRITACLLLLIFLGIVACVAVKIYLPPAPPPPFVPPAPPTPPPHPLTTTPSPAPRTTRPAPPPSTTPPPVLDGPDN